MHKGLHVGIQMNRINNEGISSRLSGLIAPDLPRKFWRKGRTKALSPMSGH